MRFLTAPAECPRASGLKAPLDIGENGGSEELPRSHTQLVNSMAKPQPPCSLLYKTTSWSLFVFVFFHFALGYEHLRLRDAPYQVMFKVPMERIKNNRQCSWMLFGKCFLPSDDLTISN